MSIYLDGSGDYLTIPDSDDWLCSQDFTVEVWVYFQAFPNLYQFFTSQWAAGTGTEGHQFYLMVGTNTVYFSVGDGDVGVTSFDFPWTPSTSIWYHVAVNRTGDDLKFYVDGSQVGTTKDLSLVTIGNVNTNFRIGCYESIGIDADSYFNGYMQELRWSKIGRYPNAFTPATEPFENDDDTVLLLHMDGDVSNSAHDITTFGETQLTPATTKFDGAMYFPGTGRLSIPDSSDWDFGTGEFTVDLWIKWATIPTSVWKGIIGQLTAAGTSDSNFEFGCQPGGGYLLNFTYLIGGSSAVTVGTSGFTWDTNWNHLAVVRDNTAGLIRIFVNGTQRGSDVIAGATSLFNSTKPLTIGGRNDTVVHDIHGYIDEPRISKGIARWTENFTPETGPY